MTDDHGLQGYDPHEFPPFAVTVDIVVFSISGDHLKVVLIERGAPPFEGAWALPGGFVHVDEDVEAAARRELAEETGVDFEPSFLTHLAAYGKPDRDPRMRVVTIAWWAIAPRLAAPVAGSDASKAELVDVNKVVDGQIELAFDHRQIVLDALNALRDQFEDTTLATTFLDGSFRISDLRRVYEIVWGAELEPGNFQRKVRRIAGLLEPTGEKSSTESGGRPAELFRGPDEVTRIDTPLRR